MSSFSSQAHSDSDLEVETTQEEQKRPTTLTPPSGLSNLFNNNDRPLNAFVKTSKPPAVAYTDQQDVSTPSSFSRSSAYFTASLPNSISAVTTNDEDWVSTRGSAMQTPSSEYNYLSRTISSSNYFDNQSDYEVILDDGTRQKRTISLSTVQLVPSKQPQPTQHRSFLDDWIASASKFRNSNRRNHYIKANHSSNKIEEEETARLLPAAAHDANRTKNDNGQQIPLPLSSDSEEEGDDDSNSSDDHDEYHDHHYQSTKRRRKRHQKNSNRLRRMYKAWSKFQNEYLTLSHKQKMVLKCSFAYTIGSLFTFVPALNALTGTHIASHMAATVTVFFNPAKSVGGMVEAAGFGWLYTFAALTLSLASMYTTDYFLDNDMAMTAMVISLGVWLAGSTFVISYLKARINTPSVLTASGLAFIILFTVIVRQGSGIEAEFDFNIIAETFFIVAIGTIISVSVCVLIWPMSASKKLKSNIDSSLSSTRILLKLLTKTFLLDADLPEFTANKTLETALKTHRTSFTSLEAALKEAKLEFYNLEMKQHADGYHKIVKSMERLAQHIGGLKSSCGLQVEVMQQTTTVETRVSSSRQSYYGAIPTPNLTAAATSSQKMVETYNLKAGPQRKKMESELKREREASHVLLKQQEQNEENAAPSSSSASYFDIISENNSNSNADKSSKNITTSGEGNSKEGALVQFIRTVRSPMKSLAYTCKQTIVHLQARFMNKTTQTTPSFRLMRQNLASAIELFEESQHQALIRFYQRRFKKYQKNTKADLHTLLLAHQQQFPADDIFLVYFFVFCLLEFAKELMTLVESVQSVFEDMEGADKSGSVYAWTRYLFGRQRREKAKQGSSNDKKDLDTATDGDIFVPNNHNTLNTLHTPAPKTRIRKFFLKLWGFFSGFRTYRVRFAMKSMLTAELISILAFIPATRPYFTSFKMEWTLITVMAVMTPTVGGTNLGAVLRVIATILGCVLAAVIYTMFQNNTFILWFMTWLISIPSFWMILHHKHGRFGLFTLLAYNLVVLFKFNHRDDDNVNVFELTWMRCVAVSLGVVIGLIVTAYVWPYEARTEIRKGLSDLLLRLSWLYKQLVSVYSEDSEDEEVVEVYHNDDTVTSLQGYLRYVENRHYYATDTTLLTRRNTARAKGLQKIELSIQLGIFDLQALLVHAPNEPRLKGPFPAKKYAAMLTCCQNILDKLLALRIVILKDVWAIHVRRHFLMPASQEFMEMAGNVFLYFYLLASALQLKTPLPPYLPPAEKTRQALMRKLQQLPLVMEESIHQLQLTEEKKDECYMVYYAYVVLMENIIRELDSLGGHMKELFGSLVPDDQWARCFGQRIDIEQSQFNGTIRNK